MSDEGKKHREPSPTLTARQRRFTEEYLIDLNGKQAAIRAGYVPQHAEISASRLLRSAKVSAVLTAAQQQRAARTGITADRVLEEIARIAFSDIRALFDENGRLRPVHALSEDVARTLGSIEVARDRVRVKTTEGGEEVTTQESVIKVKALNKVRALELLARHLGLLNDKLQLQTPHTVFVMPPGTHVDIGGGHTVPVGPEIRTRVGVRAPDARSAPMRDPSDPPRTVEKH